jgi:hypothetical protein
MRYETILLLEKETPGGRGDLKLNPMWDDLRDDPRFDRILAESAFPLATDG